MREIHINTANHGGRAATLADLIDWLWAGCEELGYKLSTSDRLFRADVPNIIFEFQNSGFKPFLDAHRGKLDLICFVTEVIAGDKFDDAHGSWDGRRRYTDFLSIAEHYRGFITSVPSNVAALRQIAPATYFELGYTELLANPVAPSAWRHDFSFSGALTPHRRQFLEAVAGKVDLHTPGVDLAQNKAVALPPADYVDLIRYSAVHICLKQHPDWAMPPQTRLARIGHARVGCAAEATSMITRQSQLFPTFTSPADFLSRFGHLGRDRAAAYAQAQEITANYRARLPHKAEIERNFDECPALRGM